jgi:hypothetical protein
MARMSGARASMVAPQTIVEHVSAQGPNVTHVRGMLLVTGRENLRELGVFEQYERLLPQSQRDAVLYALASSWVPIEVALAHYRTCDQLELDPAQIARLGALSATRIIDTLFGRALKMAQELGAASFWRLLEQNGRMYDRMYQGGGVTVLQIGPKDMWLENNGQPLASCRFWRSLYLAYMESMGRAFAKASYVHLARPRSPASHAIAITGSWV